MISNYQLGQCLHFAYLWDFTLFLFFSHPFCIQSGYTALVFAARNGQTECVRFLAESGADTEAAGDVRHI